MPAPARPQPPDDIFREVDPAKKQASAKRTAPRSIQTPPRRTTAAPRRPAPLSNQKKYLILVGIAVVLIALGGGAYYWFTHAKTDTSDGVKNNNQPINNGPVNTNAANPPRNENVNTVTGNTNIPITNTPVIPIDTDHDGLSDEEEKKLGTDPKVSDTDKDGLSDKQEVVLYKSDPKKADTDGDGITDGAEVQNGYDPSGNGKLFDINKAIK